MQAHDVVVVVDAGGGLVQQIARSIRSRGVYAEIWPSTTEPVAFHRRGVKGVVVTAEDGGAGERAAVAGNRVGNGAEQRTSASGDGLGQRVEAAGDGSGQRVEAAGDGPAQRVEAARDGVEERVSAAADLAAKYAAAGLPVRRISPTASEAELNDLMAFLEHRCGCRPTWTIKSFAADAIAEIKAQVKEGRVLSALSGGVDSAVASALVHEAIGEQLWCIFVDHGFLRKGEAEQVTATFKERFGDRFIHVDASERFLAALQGIADPEMKRKTIGEEFIRVFEEEAKKVGQVEFLLQGTLYPDVIESGVGGDVVKSHHNVGGLPAAMKLKLLEPLRYLFKDEVRALGKELGLPERIVNRQPFPGPGLAIRVIGPLDRERVAIEREADAIVVEEIERAGLARSVWQYFAVLTETRAVGVGRRGRTYGYVAAVRAVTDSDGMTASYAKLPHELLDRIASRIMDEVPQITRVVYDISNKPPATIEWE